MTKKYLVGNSWSHIFDGSASHTVRFVFDFDASSILYAEVSRGMTKWDAVSWIQCEDLADSLLTANPEALESPAEFDLVVQSFLPYWVPDTVAGERCSVSVVSDAEASNFPFLVEEYKHTGWEASYGYVSLAAAKQKAEEIKVTHPLLAVQIRHYTGGPIVGQSVPVWKFKQDSEERPYDVALWSGKESPPKVGSTVSIRINNIGPGVVTGYAVSGGYLAVQVKADNETRPEWHKKQNPNNTPALVFGAELI